MIHTIYRNTDVPWEQGKQTYHTTYKTTNIPSGLWWTYKNTLISYSYNPQKYRSTKTKTGQTKIPYNIQNNKYTIKDYGKFIRMHWFFTIYNKTEMPREQGKRTYHTTYKTTNIYQDFGEHKRMH